MISDSSSKQIKLEDVDSDKQKRIVINRDPTSQDEEDAMEESFDWDKYLAKNNATPVPKSSFHHLIAGSTFDFEPGMKLEVPNQDSSSTYWLATVIAKSGPLILLRYEGYQQDNSADFWCNSQSSEIHPVGWCAKTKHALRPPKAIQHKEKSWYDYLIKNLTGARKAAEHLFNKRERPIDKIGVGMLVEVIDKEDPTVYWVATISEIYAGRLRLQYVGTEDASGEIWSYYLNERIFEPGHGYVFGLTLRPPRDILKTISDKQWPIPKLQRRLMTCWEKDLLTELLKDRPSLDPHSFKMGMKLEAKDPRDPASICCATVARVFDKFHFLVRIDNLLSSSVHEDRSFIAHKKSCGIYPVGWCHKFGLKLHPPNGFNGHFTWKGYLQLEKAIAAPEELFDSTAIEHGFKVGMKLEAVDQENPVNICVATVTQVLGRNVWITFDGETRSEQLFDVKSFDLFPVGWCEMSGHELQWPRPSTLLQKNRISRLRSTTERKTRLDHLRKGGPRGRKSIQPGQTSSNQNSDEEKEVVTKKRKRKHIKAKYYKGSKKRIKQKGIKSTSGEEDGGYADPTISYVFIQGLGENLNDEEEIKAGFNLNEEGEIPRKVITIDSDDEDSSPTSKYPALSDEEMRFYSTLKVKPKELSEAQSEQFDLMAGVKIPVSELSSIEASSSFDRFRTSHSNSAAARIRLIDFYRMRKHKMKTRGGRFRYGIRKLAVNSGDGSRKIEELNKENLKSGDIIQVSQRSLRRGERRTNFRVLHLTGQKAIAASSKQDSASNGTVAETERRSSPRNFRVSNGMYRVVETSINKSQSKKIVMKIAKPTNSKDAKVNGASEHSLLSDGYSPARDIPSIEDHMTSKCNQIRASCKKLPKNPLTWTKTHVAEFVQAAELTEYARIFLDEEIDGHAFLLLTLSELHNLMGISVGPAAKLTDYIFTLQREADRLNKSNSQKTQDNSADSSHSRETASKQLTSTASLKTASLKTASLKTASLKTASLKTASLKTASLKASSLKPSSTKTTRTSTSELSNTPLITQVCSISKPLFSKLQKS